MGEVVHASLVHIGSKSRPGMTPEQIKQELRMQGLLEHLWLLQSLYKYLSESPSHGQVPEYIDDFLKVIQEHPKPITKLEALQMINLVPSSVQEMELVKLALLEPSLNALDSARLFVSIQS